VLVEQDRHHTTFHIPFGIGVEAEAGIFLHAVDRGGQGNVAAIVAQFDT
jgi:hypothetical protein